jgi:hypothetical protein
MELDEESLATSLRETNKVCNSGFTARFDWTGMSPDEVKDRYASTHCERALDGIRRICVDEPGRNAVKAQIKSVVCGFGTNRSVRLKDGALDYKMDFSSFNDAITVFEYLQGNL